jgi:hypothetical protein
MARDLGSLLDAIVMVGTDLRSLGDTSTAYAPLTHTFLGGLPEFTCEMFSTWMQASPGHASARGVKSGPRLKHFKRVLMRARR